jgi:hypothetical protein
MIALPGDQIADLHNDPELKGLWSEYLKMCGSKSATLGQVIYAQDRFERAYKRRRNCTAALLGVPL